MNIDCINEHYHGDPTNPRTERARQRIHWICSQAAGQEILDIGCSQGIVCLILGREGFRCNGVDIEGPSLAVAEEALAQEDELVRNRVTFRVADASQLPFPDERFDTVVLGEILEHLTHPQNALTEAKRVLREGGRVVVTVPHGLNPYHDHKRSYYPPSLLELLRPFFRTRSVDTSSHYILYTGLRHRDYRPEALSREVVCDEHLRLARMVEARCLEKEQELLGTATRLSAQIKTLTSQTTEQESQIRTMIEDSAAEKQRIQGFEKSLRQARRAKAEAHRELSRAEAELAAKDTLVASTRLESASSAAALAAVQSQLRALTKENAELRSDLLAKERDLLGLRADAEKLAVAQESARQHYVAWETECATLREELSAKDASLACARRELADSTAALTEAQREVQSQRTEAAALQQELTAQQAAWERRLALVDEQHTQRLRQREEYLHELAVKRESELKRGRTNQRICEIAGTTLPAGARALVISKGDEDLLRLGGCCGCHFPQTANGVYAGHHPANGTDTVRHLEDLKAKGADYLVIPAASFWWLDFYAEFRQHLERNCRLVAYDEAACLIYALRPALAEGSQTFSVGLRKTSEAEGSDREVPAKASSPPVPLAAEPAASGAAPAKPRDLLKLGVILDEFTTGCLEPDCKLVTFRPDNWRHILNQEHPMAVFVESAWRGNAGAWLYRVAAYERNMGNELAEVLAWAREQGLPSVFWNKEDPVHFERFIERATLFSHVFTTDADCLPRYRDHVRHDRVFALPFAAQPALHNPIRKTPRTGSVCFAGTYYGNRHEQRQADMDFVLRPAIAFGLEIFDRQHGLTGKDAESYRFPEVYQPCIRGRLDYDEMVRAYKRYRVFLNVNSVKQSPTMFSRRVFELLACGTPVISTYSRGIVELLGEDVVCITESEADTRRHLERLLGDEEAWMQASVRGIRKVMQAHTYRHRLRDVFERVGIAVPGTPEPRLCVVIHFGTAAELERLKRMLRRQTYRRFDLVLLSKAPPPARALQRLRNALPNVPVSSVVGPIGEAFAPCLEASTADHLAFMDVRDAYGPEYLMDHALAVSYSNADLAGKHTFYKATAAGERQLQDAGYEFAYVTSVQSATLLVRKKALSKKLFVRALSSRVFRLDDAQVLSLDRSSYVQNAPRDDPFEPIGSDVVELRPKEAHA
jgi:spore maturation protein CgeB/SAM-dependent methyltransferase